MTTSVQPAARTHPIVALSVLEAVRSVDFVPDEGHDDFHRELASKRLGMSRTVATQIERYQQLVRRGARVDAGEVEGILRLVGRRSDAEQVFEDAGRRAARFAAERLSLASRALHRGLPRFARRRLGVALTRRVLSRAFGLTVTDAPAGLDAGVDDSLPARATPNGVACGLYGAALDELLRTLADFTGVVSHPKCRARGDDGCRWQAEVERP